MSSVVASPIYVTTSDYFGAFFCFLKLNMTCAFLSCVCCLVCGVLSLNVYAQITTTPLSQTTSEITLCGNEALPAGMFCCENNQTISGGAVCNMHSDCSDASDERPEACNECEQFNLFKCTTQNLCLTRDSMCDGVADCLDKSDEGSAGCGCSVEQTQCPGEFRCISENEWCNDKKTPQCISGFDEDPEKCRQFYINHPMSFQFICYQHNKPTVAECLRHLKSVLCHDHALFGWGDTQAILERTQIKITTCNRNVTQRRSGSLPTDVQCGNSGLYEELPEQLKGKNYRCTGWADGALNRGETFYCPSIHGNGTTFCFNKKSLCNGHADCEGGVDELPDACHLRCRPGQVYCASDRRCWNPARLCNGGQGGCSYDEHPRFCTYLQLDQKLKNLCPEGSDEDCKSYFRSVMCQKVTTLISNNYGENSFSTLRAQVQNSLEASSRGYDLSTSGMSDSHNSERRGWLQSTVVPFLSSATGSGVVVAVGCWVIYKKVIKPVLQESNRIRGNSFLMDCSSTTTLIND